MSAPTRDSKLLPIPRASSAGDGPRASAVASSGRSAPRAPTIFVALALGAVIGIFTYASSWFTPVAPFWTHLGAEYYNIASSLARGRGFSSPFGSNTGPTAWMPPFFPYFLAGLLLVLRRKILVAQAVVALTAMALTAVGVQLFSIARRQRVRVSPVTIVGIYAAWLWTFYDWFFMMTHDIWLLTLVVSFIAFVYFRYTETGAMNPWAWGGLGGLTAVTSPSLSFAWAGLSLFVARRDRASRRPLLMALGLALAVATPWTVRNAYVFHQFIPTKSNLSYEAYQANYLDDDGIYDGTFEHHPYNSGAARAEYVSLGERGYLEEHKRRFFASLHEDPARYLRAVIHRLSAVTVRYVPSKNAFPRPVKSAVAHVFYAMPFLAMVGLVAFRRGRSSFALGMATFSVAYLIPYVLVAFYLRYMMPLTPVLVIFMFTAVDRLAAARRGASIRRPAPAPGA